MLFSIQNYPQLMLSDFCCDKVVVSNATSLALTSVERIESRGFFFSFFILFFNYMTCNVIFVSGVQHTDSTFIYVISWSPQLPLPLLPVHSADCIPCYSSVTYLCHNLRFVPWSVSSVHLFHPTSNFLLPGKHVSVQVSKTWSWEWDIHSNAKAQRGWIASLS